MHSNARAVQATLGSFGKIEPRGAVRARFERLGAQNAPITACVENTLHRILPALCLVCACGAAPPQDNANALYRDLRRIVAIEEDTEWVVDRTEYEDALASALKSVCQVSPLERAELSTWLDTQIRLEGGASQRRYLLGESLSELSETQTLERVAGLLAYAEKHASADCPYWLQAQEDFDAVHGSYGRLVIMGESFGGGSLLLRDGKARLGGGGGGRLTLGSGLSTTLTLVGGLEVTASATIREDSAGALNPRVNVLMAAPLILRISDSHWYYDFEVTGGAQVDDDEGLAPMFRAAFSSGIAALRVGDLQPYGGLWLGYEYLGAFDSGPPTHAIRLGTRVGFNFAP